MKRKVTFNVPCSGVYQSSLIVPSDFDTEDKAAIVEYIVSHLGEAKVESEIEWLTDDASIMEEDILSVTDLNPRFEYLIENETIPDSMCFDSGTEICYYTEGDSEVIVEVRGHVTVYYKGERYSHYSDMPKELQQMFIDGTADGNEEVYIYENNWYEIFYDGGCDYDIATIEDMNVSELQKYCEDSMVLFRYGLPFK